MNLVLTPDDNKGSFQHILLIVDLKINIFKVTNTHINVCVCVCIFLWFTRACEECTCSYMSTNQTSLIVFCEAVLDSGAAEQRLSGVSLFIQSHLMFSNRLPNVSSNQG